MTHYENWIDHQIYPLCGDMSGSSRSYSKDKRLVDCPRCWDYINEPCSWCNGRGYFEEWGEKNRCGQCEGTGYAHLEFHQIEEG